jgi:hypothetical protein
MCGQHRHRHRRHTATAAGTRLAADDKRASDAERDAVVAELRAHAAEGRLTVEELDERITAALAALTRAELARLLDDLPRRPRPVAEQRRDVREHARSYLTVMALLVAIWALTGAGYFWPIWPILGWGIGVLSHASAARRPRRRDAFG